MIKLTCDLATQYNPDTNLCDCPAGLSSMVSGELFPYGINGSSFCCQDWWQSHGRLDERLSEHAMLHQGIMLAISKRFSDHVGCPLARDSSCDIKIMTLKIRAYGQHDSASECDITLQFDMHGSSRQIHHRASRRTHVHLSTRL